MPADLLAFGHFELDAQARRLTRQGEPVGIAARQFDVLHALVVRAGQVLSKDQLIDAAWNGVAVTDNSVEQVVSGLRRLLSGEGGEPCIETLARRGYRFTAAVRRVERREPDAALDALLAPHKAWIEGRAALETLERDHILHAREVFERVLTDVPDQAAAHVGLANACALQFEMTRSLPERDDAALHHALDHAREACRLDLRYGEAWATLGFVLDRTGQHADALAASRRAVALEPDNWRHRMRLAYVSWGEERLREAGRTLALLPGFPLAHWLAATVHVARQALGEAERQLVAGIAAEHASLPGTARFEGVALHWLLGLLLMARGDDAGAEAEFERELQRESNGQLYARECCANTWYALGALRLRLGQRDAAVAALRNALARVPIHLPAKAMLAHLGALDATAFAGGEQDPRIAAAANGPETMLARAVQLTLKGDTAAAARTLDETLARTPDGSALWLLPIEPGLHVTADPGPWGPVLARLRSRAA